MGWNSLLSCFIYQLHHSNHVLLDILDCVNILKIKTSIFSAGYLITCLVLNMRLLEVLLAFLLTYIGATTAHDAVALFGGGYPDGFMDNEVEVWSHSSSCNLEIPSTPDSFRDGPGVAVLEDKIYVCGGHRMGTSHTTHTCDVYSMTDKAWTAGPSFNKDTHPLKVHLATVGSRLVTAYTMENRTDGDWGPTTDQLVVSVLDPVTSQEWRMLTLLECDNCWSYLSGFGKVDENHVGIVEVFPTEYPPKNDTRTLHVVNVETGKAMTVDTPDFAHCGNAFVFDGLFTCLFPVAGSDIDRDLYSLTYNGEDDLKHEWTKIGSIPKGDYYHAVNGPFLQLDGMLTSLNNLNDGLIYWKDELEDEEWKTAEIEIPRQDVGWAILQCS